MVLTSSNSRETELTAIGMALMDSKVAGRIATLPDDLFSESDTQLVHQTIKRIINKKLVPDVATVMTENPDTSNLVLDAVQRTVTTVNYSQYETMLLDLRQRRRIQNACAIAVSKTGSMDVSTETIIQEFNNSTKNDVSTNGVVNMQEAVLQLMDDVDKAKSATCKTGISGLDSMIGGLKGGKLVYIGARPGVGKTALALYIAMHISNKEGRVLFASLEMTPAELTARMVSAWSNVPVDHIESGRLDEKEYEALTYAYSKVAQMRLNITNTATSPLLLRRQACEMKDQDEGLKMIVVDYVQLMKSDVKTKSRYEDVSNISRELKLLAMELETPIIVLTQFNRTSEANGGVPTMSEAKDSGSIEQDANIFITQYVPEEPKDTNSFAYSAWKGCKERGSEYQVLRVEKNRQGRKGAIDVEFDKAHMIFKTLINDTGRR